MNISPGPRELGISFFYSGFIVLRARLRDIAPRPGIYCDFYLRARGAGGALVGLFSWDGVGT